MAERVVPVVQVMVHMDCDEPNCKGEMIATGDALLSYPARYPHKCNQCGCTATYKGHRYPGLEFREVKSV